MWTRQWGAGISVKWRLLDTNKRTRISQSRSAPSVTSIFHFPSRHTHAWAPTWLHTDEHLLLLLFSRHPTWAHQHAHTVISSFFPLGNIDATAVHFGYFTWSVNGTNFPERVSTWLPCHSISVWLKAERRHQRFGDLQLSCVKLSIFEEASETEGLPHCSRFLTPDYWQPSTVMFVVQVMLPYIQMDGWLDENKWARKSDALFLAIHQQPVMG